MATLIYRRTGGLRAVQLLLGYTKADGTGQVSGIEVLLAETFDIPVEPPDQKLADLAGSPVRLLALKPDNKALDLLRQLVRAAHGHRDRSVECIRYEMSTYRSGRSKRVRLARLACRGAASLPRGRAVRIAPMHTRWGAAPRRAVRGIA
jgi:hypothetical protein